MIKFRLVSQILFSGFYLKIVLEYFETERVSLDFIIKLLWETGAILKNKKKTQKF